MSSVFNYTNSLDYLRDEFELRLRRNKNYSMRCFARDIGTSASTLSEFFSGKHKISAKNSEKIATKIFSLDTEKDYFLQLCRLHQVVSKSSLTHIEKRIADIQSKRNKKISLNNFSMIKDWFSLPFLELVGMRKNISISSAAKVLGVLPESIKKLVKNLQEIKLLNNEEGEWQVKNSNTYVGENIESSCIKDFHQQIMDKAQYSLYYDPNDEREFSNNIFAINKKDLPEMKKYLIQMRRDFQRKFETTDNQDDIYTLSLQFFSLLKEDLE